MAFSEIFDKIKNTSSSALDKAKDTTKRFATVNELKSTIRGYNNEKNSLFSQMGMDIYLAKKKGKELDSEITEFVSQIDELNHKIKQAQERLALVETTGFYEEFDDDGDSEETVSDDIDEK